MGCDIHIITQIRKNGEWEYIEEVPQKFNERNYSTFAVLANVRNSFHFQHFNPKGLPNDLKQRKFSFESERNWINKNYNENSETKIKLPDGSLIDNYDERVRKIVSAEEKDNYNGWTRISDNEFRVIDVSLVNGEYVEVSYTELYTFEEFVKKYYEDEWDEVAQDYGYWKVNFDSEDYHSHSYLTLKELDEFDVSDYKMNKVNIPKSFYDKFIEFGGKLPEQMSVGTEVISSDFGYILRQALCPEVVISYPIDESDTERLPFIEGIRQLKDIADKYGCEYDDIRIVFAFDN